MIDIVREIEAAQREVGSAPIAAGEGRSVRLTPDVRGVHRRRLGRARRTRSGSAAGSCRSAATSASAGDTSSRATRAARSSPASARTACGSPGSTWTPATRRTSPSSRCGCRRPATTRRSSSSTTPPSCRTTRGASTGPAPSASAGTWGVLGLALHLRGGSVGDPLAWQVSAEGRDFATRSSEAWGAANRAAGADPDAWRAAWRTRPRSTRPSRPPGRSPWIGHSTNRAGRVRVTAGALLARPTVSSTAAPPTA